MIITKINYPLTDNNKFTYRRWICFFFHYYVPTGILENPPGKNFPATTFPTCSWINSSSFFHYAPSVAWQPEPGCRGDVAGCHGSGRPRCRCPNPRRDPGSGNFPLPLPSRRCWARLPWKLGGSPRESRAEWRHLTTSCRGGSWSCRGYRFRSVYNVFVFNWIKCRLLVLWCLHDVFIANFRSHVFALNLA